MAGDVQTGPGIGTDQYFLDDDHPLLKTHRNADERAEQSGETKDKSSTGNTIEVPIDVSISLSRETAEQLNELAEAFDLMAAATRHLRAVLVKGRRP